MFVGRSGSATKLTIWLRFDPGGLLAEKIGGQGLLVDSFAGRTSTLGLPSGLRQVRSTVGACNARADVKPSMNSVRQPEWIF